MAFSSPSRLLIRKRRLSPPMAYGATITPTNPFPVEKHFARERHSNLCTCQTLEQNATSYGKPRPNESISSPRPAASTTWGEILLRVSMQSINICRIMEPCELDCMKKRPMLLSSVGKSKKAKLLLPSCKGASLTFNNRQVQQSMPSLLIRS